MIGPKEIGGLTETSKMPGLSFSLPALITCPLGSKLAQLEGTPCSGCYALKGAYAWKGTRAAQARRYALLAAAMDTQKTRDGWASALGSWLHNRENKARKRSEKAGAPDPENLQAYYDLKAAGARCTAGAKRITAGSEKNEKPECIALAKVYKKAAARWGLVKNDKAEALRVKHFLAWDNSRHFRWHDSGDVFDLRYMGMVATVAALSPAVAHWLPSQERATVKRQIALTGKLPENLIVRFSSPRVDVHPLPKPGATLLASSVSSNGTTKGNLCPAYTRGGTCGPCRACWDPSVSLVTYPIH